MRTASTISSGFKSGYHDYYTHHGGDGEPDLWENDKPIEKKGYTTDLVTERCRRFIEEHEDAPFFVDVAYTAPHWPYQLPGNPSVAPNNARHVTAAGSTRRARARITWPWSSISISRSANFSGDRPRGPADDTIVIFTNDNGGEWLSSSAPFFRPQVDRVRGWHSRAGHRALARSDPGRQGLRSGRHHDGSDRCRSSRSRARRCPTKRSSRVESLPRLGGSGTRVRAHAVLALRHGHGHADRRAPRRLEGARRRSPTRTYSTCAATSASATTSRNGGKTLHDSYSH